MPDRPVVAVLHNLQRPFLGAQLLSRAFGGGVRRLPRRRGFGRVVAGARG
jgi:hypothetical protein